MEQLDLFASAPTIEATSWMDADTWSYYSGLPDRSGIARYTHLIRGPHDGEREAREARQARIGKEAASTEWQRLTRGDVATWSDAIEQLMRDGASRTFNAIVLALTSGAMTADTAFGKDPDRALWRLVEAGTLWWTQDAPVHFLHRDHVTRCSCAKCAKEAA